MCATLQDQDSSDPPCAVFVLYFYYSFVDARCGLQELHLKAANLGYLFTSMVVGSVISGAFIIPWARARYSPQRITIFANLILLLNSCLMMLVHRPHRGTALAPTRADDKERKLLDKLRNFRIDPNPPEEWISLSVEKEVLNGRVRTTGLPPTYINP